MKEETFRKVWIKSEEDLPKEAGKYVVNVRDNTGIDVYKYFDYINPIMSDHQKEYWINTFDWYLQPISQPEQEQNLLQQKISLLEQLVSVLYDKHENSICNIANLSDLKMLEDDLKSKITTITERAKSVHPSTEQSVEITDEEIEEWAQNVDIVSEMNNPLIRSEDDLSCYAWAVFAAKWMRDKMKSKDTITTFDLKEIDKEREEKLTLEDQIKEYVKEHEEKFSLVDFAKWARSLILFLMMLAPMSLLAQRSFIDAVYVSYQPVDFGFGLRADYHLGSVGLYNSLSYGDGLLYREYDMSYHYKFTMGVRIPMRDYLDNKYGINIGINYHTLGSYVKESITWDTHLFNPWSFELGISLYCWGKFALGIRTDILRNEPCLDLGYAF